MFIAWRTWAIQKGKNEWVDRVRHACALLVKNTEVELACL